MSSSLAQFHELQLTQHAATERCFQASEIRDWCEMANIATGYQHVPEPLIAGLFSYLLGEKLPGHGTNYLKQSMRFASKARIGERLTASVIITRLRPDKALVDLRALCTGEDGRMICAGESLVLFQR